MKEFFKPLDEVKIGFELRSLKRGCPLLVPTTAEQPKHNETERPTSVVRPRLHYLDGIRGLAALYIVLFHIKQWAEYSAPSVDLPKWWGMTGVLDVGSDAVTIFIVLSGFCLMLPIAKSGAGTLPNGSFNYFKRRARRILPPYYVALMIFVPLSLLVPILQHPSGGHFDINPGHHLWPALISHILLVHNLSPEWIYSFDGPMWSVATEWQIYFLFPLVLLPSRKVFGIVAPIIVGYGLGIASFYHLLTGACFWYIGSFGVGMVAADCSVGNRWASLTLQTWRKVASITGAFWLVFVIFLIAKHVWLFGPHILYVKDIVTALAAGSTLVYLYKETMESHSSSARPSLLYKLVASKAVVWLGTFSYSIYLIHYPIGELFARLLAPKSYNVGCLFFELLACLPLLLGLAYLFHVTFEKRFMNSQIQALAV